MLGHIVFPQWLEPTYILTSSVQVFPFLHFFANICYLWSFDDSHFDRLVDISWWFWFTFPWWLAMLSIFSYACWPSAFPLWKNSFSGHFLLSNGTIDTMKRQPAEWKKIFANNMTEKLLIFNICKELIQLNIKKTNWLKSRKKCFSYFE